ncbi:MAG: DNA replication/repair protein RecF [Clostridia bacterium]|nr:DNA replication/repair protein RecF [Clostridia bacterium]
MKLTTLSVRHFRNMQDVTLTPCDGMNVLYGDNAHGKTNLLEAIWLLTGGKSFRGTKDADMVMFGQPKAAIDATFEAGGRRQTASVTIEQRRKATLNGVALPAANRLTGHVCAVIFSPDHLSLIKDGPDARRRFLDAACCQLRPLYMKVLADYTRTLTQRNKLIKAVKNGEQRFDDLLFDAFDERLCLSGAAVRTYRREYMEALTPYVQTMYDGLSGAREQMTLAFNESLDAEELKAALKTARQTDLRAGFTTVGPHRDDIDVKIGDCSARLFGSQGQQRSAVLALKLAEGALLAKGYHEKPLILLDDVMSELDRSRQEYILNHIDGFQVFITCCDPANIERLHGGSTFHIQNGGLKDTTGATP